MQFFNSQIYSAISNSLHHISKGSRVEVLGVEFNSAVLKSIAAFLDVSVIYLLFLNDLFCCQQYLQSFSMYMLAEVGTRATIS